MASSVDSIGHMDKGSYSLAQSTNANVAASSAGLWSGEFLVKFDVARRDTVDGSTGLGKFGAFTIGMSIHSWTTAGVRSGLRTRPSVSAS